MFSKPVNIQGPINEIFWSLILYIHAAGYTWLDVLGRSSSMSELTYRSGLGLQEKTPQNTVDDSQIVPYT